MLRRAFGTIHEGHCHDGWDVVSLFDFLKSHLDDSQYHAGALALEETESGNLHIQFYVECTRKRITTMMRDFLVTNEAVFDRVKSAQGSWDYCTGEGKHADKPALARHSWGTPILYGGSASADLRLLVDLVIDGQGLDEIMRAYPYAFCVHRSRLLGFYEDWNRTCNDIRGQ